MVSFKINLFIVLIVTRNRKDSCPTTMPRSSCNLIGALWRNSVTNCTAPFSRNSNSKLILCSYLMVVFNWCCDFSKISLQCFGMGIFCEASTAESWKGSRSQRRGCRANCQKGLNCRCWTTDKAAVIREHWHIGEMNKMNCFFSAAVSFLLFSYIF